MSVLLALFALQNEPPCEVKLLTSSEVVQPESDYVYALEFSPKQGWHIYWKNPGDSGVAPTIKWDLPEGWTANELQFPSPTLFEEGSMVTYGFSSKTVIVGSLKVPKIDMSRPVTLNGVVSWMACQDTCLTGTTPVTMTLQPSLGTAITSKFVTLIKDVSRPLLESTAREVNSGYVLQLNLASKPESLYFYPDTPGVLAHTKLQSMKSKGNSIELELLKSEFANGTPSRLTGVLEAKSKGKARFFAIDATITK